MDPGGACTGRLRTYTARVPVPDPAQPTPAPAPSARGANVAMAALALLAFAGIMVAGRKIDLFYDEWSFVLFRRAWNASAFLDAHNEHISVLPVLVYKLWFGLFGLEHHWMVRAVLAALLAGLGVVVYLLARRRIGPWGGVVAAALVLVMGRAIQNIVWAFQIGFVGSVVFGLLALLALDRPGRRGDVLACAALVASVLCSSLGVPFAVGVAAELAVTRRRALWVPAVPLAVYGAWWLGYGRGKSDITRQSIEGAASWAYEAAANAAGGAVGLPIEWGRTLLVLLVVAIVWQVARATTQATPRLLALVVVAVTFWGLTGAARSVGTPATETRYITLGAVLMILAAVELVRGTRPSRRVLAIGAALVVVSAAAAFPTARDYTRSLAAWTGDVNAELGALTLVRDRAPADYQLSSGLAPQITAGRFFDAIDDLDSTTADTAAELPRDFNQERVYADRVLQDVALSAAPATGAAPASCKPLGAGGVELTVPASGVVLDGRGRAAVQVGRFSDGFANSPSPVPVAGPTVLRFAPDRSPVPYRVKVSAADGAVRLCA